MWNIKIDKMAKVVFQGNMISTDYIGFHILFFILFSFFFVQWHRKVLKFGGDKLLNLIKILGQMNNLRKDGNSVKIWWGQYPLFPFDPVPLLRVVWRLKMEVSHMRWSMDKKTILHTVFSRILRTLQIEGGTREGTIYIVGQ